MQRMSLRQQDKQSWIKKNLLKQSQMLLKLSKKKNRKEREKKLRKKQRRRSRLDMNNNSRKKSNSQKHSKSSFQSNLVPTNQENSPVAHLVLTISHKNKLLNRSLLTRINTITLHPLHNPTELNQLNLIKTQKKSHLVLSLRLQCLLRANLNNRL